MHGVIDTPMLPGHAWILGHLIRKHIDRFAFAVFISHAMKWQYNQLKFVSFCFHPSHSVNSGLVIKFYRSPRLSWGHAGLIRKWTDPDLAESDVSPGFHWAPTATSTFPSPSMSRAAMHTLSDGVKLSTITNRFQSPLRYQTNCFLSANKISGFLSPSTSPIARPYPIAYIVINYLRLKFRFLLQGLEKAEEE